MMCFNGMKVYVNNNLIVRRQNKTHRWKWLNRIYCILFGYYYIPDPEVYMFKNRIIGHSETINQLKYKYKNGG